jgi:hypothetical protein
MLFVVFPTKERPCLTPHMSTNLERRSLENFISVQCVVRPGDGLRSRLTRAKGSSDIHSRARRSCPVITVGRLTGLTIVIYSLFSKSDGIDEPDRPAILWPAESARKTGALPNFDLVTMSGGGLGRLDLQSLAGARDRDCPSFIASGISRTRSTCRPVLGFTHVTARRIAQPPIGDLCHEASTRVVTRTSRSSATGSIDKFPGGFFLH